MKDVLTSVQLYWRGHPYYGDLMGLTDADGLVQITRERLEADFLRDQQLFPMDYREPLDLCDPVLEIKVRGGDEFSNAKVNVETNPLVDADVRDAYARAANQRIASSHVRIDLLDARSDQMAIDMHLNAVGDSRM